MGVSHWSPDQDRDVEEALNEADRKMYEDKKENGKESIAKGGA